MNESKVVFVTLKLNLAYFEQYDCQKAHEICFQMAELNNFLNCANNDDTVILLIFEDYAIVKFVPKKGKRIIRCLLGFLNQHDEDSFEIPVNISVFF